MTKQHPGVRLAGLRGGQVKAAYTRLREAIVRGSLAPGTRIMETDVARWLDLSRSSVRTVLHRLQHEGFVEAHGDGPRSRLTVAPLTRDDFWELSEVVGEVEGLAAARVARRPSPDRRTIATNLRGINRRLAKAVRATPRDQLAVFRLDDEFHRTLVEAAASRRLNSLHHAVKPQLQRYEGVYFSMAERGEDSVKEHEAAIQAVEAGEPDRAHEAIRRNLVNAAAHLSQRIEALGERGAFGN
ncbi:MAG: GntR family transcriptional regulator [Gemmatimonadota bacterium]